MRILTVTFLFMALLLGGCTSNRALPVDNYSANDTSPEAFVNRILGTCAGFAKSGAEQGYGTELDIFNFCLNEAIEQIEKVEEGNA